MIVAGGYDGSVRNADRAIPNPGRGLVNLGNVTFVVECKGAIVTTEEMTAMTAQIANIVVELDIDGGLTDFAVVL